MSRNNDVFQVLVTSGDQSIASAGDSVSDLLPGQIGIFDYDTNLALDNTSAAVRKFYLAVGIDDGAGGLGDINKSAGSYLEGKFINGYSFREHTADQPMILTVSDITAECDQVYGIKLEFRNQEIYRTQGYNQFAKTFVVKTACCDGCVDDCPSADGNEIVKLLKNEINLDELGLAVAEAIAGEAITIVTHGVSQDYALGEVMTDADVDVVIAFNAAQPDSTTWAAISLQVTTVAQAVNNFCKINLLHFYPRQTFVVASLTSETCNFATLTTTQELAFEEGSGYDIQRQEFEAGGWNGKSGPYRLSTLNGVANENIEYFADKTEIYSQIHLTYDQFSVGGWQEFLNNLATTIAIPETDTTTRDELVVALDVQLTNQDFDALADDAAASTTTDTVTETADTDDVTLDGMA